MFLESIKFYEHVEVLLKISDVLTNVFEALRGNPALDHDTVKPLLSGHLWDLV